MSERDDIHRNPDSPYYALPPWQREIGERVARGERLRMVQHKRLGTIAVWWKPQPS